MVKANLQSYSDYGIDVGNKISGQLYTTCPKCSHDRKKKSAKCLGVNLDKGIWHCVHCNWSGSLGTKSYPLPKWENKTGLSDQWAGWLLSRNITQETANKLSITHGNIFMPGAGKEVSTIQFPYFKDGKVINVKYRDLDKNFMLSKGSELIFYNVDGLKGENEAIIVEGEIDALTLIQAGYTNTISVPNGAGKGENKLGYIDLKDFQGISKVLIATDNDEPGNKLADDLARHLGIERCHRLRLGEYKDINEMLCKSGNVELLDIIPYSEILKAEQPDFKKYIIRAEPEEEIGIVYINGVCVLSLGNILLLTGPMKGRKTMLASILVNQCKLKTAYIDTEQGKKHSWRTGQFTPTADVFHLRGQDHKEIKKVIEQCVASGEYELIVIDNIRDLILDFNNVEQSGEIELFLKKISEQVPVIAILHENKNSTKGQGHVGHGLAKIAQTAIRVQLVDVEDPARGSFVECVHSRDEPFRRAFISKEGQLSNDNIIKFGGQSMLQEELFRRIGGTEYTRDELNETLAEIFGINVSSAKNALTQIRKACPGVITERKEGKRKIYYVSSALK